MSKRLAVASAVILTTLAALLLETSSAGLSSRSAAAISGFYLVVGGIIAGFGVWTADQLGLPTFLLARPLPGRTRLRILLVHGIGMGIWLAIASAALAGYRQGGALRPWFWREIQTETRALLFAANAALIEETFFRLFLVPFLVSVVLRFRPHRFRLRVRGGRATAATAAANPQPWLILAAVLGSSVLFGLAHPFNFVAAVLLGPFLAHSYLRGGWESAVLAHFVANALVFSLYF